MRHRAGPAASENSRTTAPCFVRRHFKVYERHSDRTNLQSQPESRPETRLGGIVSDCCLLAPVHGTQNLTQSMTVCAFSGLFYGRPANEQSYGRAANTVAKVKLTMTPNAARSFPATSCRRIMPLPCDTGLHQLSDAATCPSICGTCSGSHLVKAPNPEQTTLKLLSNTPVCVCVCVCVCVGIELHKGGFWKHELTSAGKRALFAMQYQCSDLGIDDVKLRLLSVFLTCSACTAVLSYGCEIWGL